MKDKIIKASIESLRQEGLRFSVDTLAEKLKISKKTIYKFFPDKESLAVALYESQYAAAVQQAELLVGEDRPALRIIVDGSLEKLCETDLNPDAVIERLVYWLW